MKSRFPSIRLSLMVGIGGGVPGAEADTRLNDVVISQPFTQHGSSSIRLWKDWARGVFHTNGQVECTTYNSLASLAKLRSNYIRRRVKLSGQLSPLNRLPEFTSFPALPGASRSMRFCVLPSFSSDALKVSLCLTQ